MKVKDLQRQLSWFDPETEILFKERDGRDIVLNTKIRVYFKDGRALIDGYEPEQ